MLVDINLLPKKEPKNYALLAIILVALFIFLAAGSFIFWQGTSYDSKITMLDNQIKTTKKLAEAAQTALTNKQGPNTTAELEAAVKWADDVPLKSVPVIKKVTALLPARGFIQTITYTEAGTVSLTVQFDMSREAAYYLKSLLDSEWISEVSLQSITTNLETQTEKSESTVPPTNENQYIPRSIGQFEIKLDRDFINKQEKETKERQQGGNGS